MSKPKMMPNMSLDQQIAGVRRAVKTLSARKKGPTWLLPSLRKRLRQLVREREKRLEKASGNRDLSGNLDPSSAKRRADMGYSLSVTEVTSPDR